MTIDPETGKATREADYYVLGHVTKFVQKGAVRIGSTVEGNIWNVAFRNPDGSTVVLVNNDDWGSGSQRFNLRMGSQSLSYDLPAGGVATFVSTASERTPLSVSTARERSPRRAKSTATRFGIWSRTRSHSRRRAISGGRR